MADLVLDNIDSAPAEVVKRAARDFAAALVETPQFNKFELSTDRFRQDPAAQQALHAYQEKQTSWRALLMLNALSAEQRDELESLRIAFIDQPVVKEYFAAQRTGSFEPTSARFPNPLRTMRLRGAIVAAEA
jgi:cell fate (sporulation/competence/biofilm development) regulator YlbF (YheA/YmcA/DUF963 family)